MNRLNHFAYVIRNNDIKNMASGYDNESKTRSYENIKMNIQMLNVTKRFNLANKYFKFLGDRTKIKSETERKNFIFK